jgi:hypothetical protein
MTFRGLQAAYRRCTGRAPGLCSGGSATFSNARTRLVSEQLDSFQPEVLSPTEFLLQRAEIVSFPRAASPHQAKKQNALQNK